MLDLLWILFGFVLLFVGGEALVRGASGLALISQISPAVIALTVVAAGTSMPELVVSVQAAFQGSAGLSVGNVVGSNLFNIGLILGMAAMLRPLQVLSDSVRLQWPVMMLATVQVWLLARDGWLDRVEGFFLLLGVVLFMAYAVWIGRTGASEAESDGSQIETASFGRSGTLAWLFNAAAVGVGVVLLMAGSSALVSGAVGLARAFGVTETLIGLTIVAAGTGTPELVTSLIAARKGRDEIAIGNVIGSNIFNLLGILGVTAAVRPLPIPVTIVESDFAWLGAVSALLFLLMRTGMRISRREGALLLGVYVFYLFLLQRT